MGRYVLRRLLWTPLVLLVLVTLTFALIKAAPGNPFAMDRVVSEEIRAQLEARYGLDKPAIVQFGQYLGRVVTDFDFGPSMKFKDRTVNDIIANGIGPTMLLGACAVILAVAIGLTAGTIGAVRQNSVFDHASMSAATFGMSVPNFVTGPVLVLVFALSWKALPVSGFDPSFSLLPALGIAALHVAWRVTERIRVGPAGFSWGREFACLWLGLLLAAVTSVVTLLARSPTLILPAVTLALPFASRIARLMRAGMLEVIGQDYVRTARAKGLSETTVVVRHALKGGILPVVSYLGPAITGVLTGSLVVEKIFAIPGIGREFVEAALSRDYMLVLGIVVLDGLLLVLFNLAVDVVYGFLDPRIRYE
ncbi:MAG: Dipeptide transport system permease protein DppB [Planctomycetes bacterium]|nr:Dipeptide transport system permease protein DppB [Planctomycetota bacterium]